MGERQLLTSEYIDKLSTTLIPIATGLESICLMIPDNSENPSEAVYHKMQEISQEVPIYYQDLKRNFDKVDKKSKTHTANFGLLRVIVDQLGICVDQVELFFQQDYSPNIGKNLNAIKPYFKIAELAISAYHKLDSIYGNTIDVDRLKRNSAP
jgi:hypothetical protein